MEAAPLQAILDIVVLVIGIAAIVFGMMMGYLLGGQSSLKPVDRILVGAIGGLIGGIIISIAIGTILQPTDPMMPLSIISCVAGVFFGESIHWAPPPKREPKRHVYFEPDDDDDFDREIEEALSGSS